MIEREKKNIFQFVLFFLLIFGVSCAIAGESSAASTPVTLLKKADQCRNSLYKSSKRMKYRHNWMNCIEKYENIYNTYPEKEQAVWAMYRSAKMYIKLNKYSGLESDLDKALELFERVTSEYKDHRLADDAQFQMGQIYYLYKKNLTQAYVEYLKVDIKFPSGDMRPRAKEMMDKLTVILGKDQEKKEPPEENQSSSSNKLTAVNDIRHWSTPSYTRVVIDLEKPVKYTYNLLKEDPDLKKPRRLYIDLDKTYVGADIDTNIPIKDQLLQRARAGQYDADTVRVVLDINSIQGNPNIFPLYDPFRVVVDVRGEPEKTTKKKATIHRKDTRAPRKGIMKPEKPDGSVSLARQLGLSVKRIVIDPGHGGRDPGCFEGKEREKNIVLNLAKKLKTRIEKRLGCEVLLTRETDVFVPLDERTAFANIKKADLFISLHVNAHLQTSIFGVETYFLNMATDKRAVMLAARENATSEKNISDLQTILSDLMLNTKISESSKLAYQVQIGMMKDIKKQYKKHKDLGVKQAPFYVLIGAEMPAILIETGFITNSMERKRLLSDEYRDMLADGIVDGIDSYIESINRVGG